MRAALLLLACLASAARADVFPHGQDLFPILLADPRHIQIGGSYYRLDGRNAGDIALGHSWGLTRNGGAGWDWQAEIEGMAYSRFQLAGSVNEFQTIDFFGNLPVEARKGAFSGKFMLFHESSHLGDDYIRATGDSGFRFSVDGLRLIAAVDASALARAYAGATYLLHTVPSPERRAFQGGLELKTRVFELFGECPSWVYLASDLQTWERASWNLNSRTVLGLRLGFRDNPRALRVYIGRFEGRSAFGQFFRKRERINDIGVSFDL